MNETIELRHQLWGSFLLFVKTFFPLVTGREFLISRPIGRESHFITIARALTRASRLQCQRLLINVAPGSGKSVLLSMWVAWTMSKYPDSQYLYVSYSHELATKHTEFIRRIIQNSHYRSVFGVDVRTDSKAKDHFQTTSGGSVKAFGSAGSITGCFDYNTLVHTEHGLVKIGELVETKSEIQVPCYNNETNSIELKPIIGWFENPANDIIEVEFSDGSTIRCTPDHKILTTNRNWVQAKDLLSTDNLFSLVNNNTSTDPNQIGRFSLRDIEIINDRFLFESKFIVNSFMARYFNFKNLFPTSNNNAWAYSEFPGKSFNWFRNIFNFFELIVRKFRIFKLFSMQWSNPICINTTYSTNPNINDCSSTNTIQFTNLTRFDVFESKFTDLDYFFFRKLFKFIVSSMNDCVLHILRSSSVTEINKVVVQGITIQMPDVCSLWSFSDESLAYQGMNRSSFFTPVLEFNSNHFISSSAHPRFKNSSFIRNNQPTLVSSDPVITSNHPSIRNRIKLISTRHKSPVNIRLIGHEDITYCLEIKDNHNFIVSGSSGSTIVSNCDAGLPNLERFSGAVVLDDLIKPDHANSDTIRETVLRNYQETILQRPRSPNVPIISIGQRVHEDDVSAFFLSGKDERPWETVILKSIDDAGNAMYPEVHPLDMLLSKKEKSPYVFSSQFQQEPVPSGGALFKESDFVLLDEDPKILSTFITCDTAETNKSYNDASAFSFWGIYKLDTGQLALHWLDCLEIRVEPKDLESEFRSFYADCMIYPVKPMVCAIEKKSTGVTLCSILQGMRGLDIREVKRTKASGSKTDRYLEMQPILASKLVSFTRGAKHVNKCIEHMLKITANSSHRHDDVCHAAGSKIATIRGSINIEDIIVGDKIITPFGIGIVSACGITGYHKVIKKIGLESTPDHQVFTQRGFLPLDSVYDDDKIDYLSFKGLLLWRLKKRLYLMEKNIHAESRENIIEVAQEYQKIEHFTEPFLNFIAEKKYQKALTYTILMAIDSIIVLKIWNFYLGANIVKNIQIKLKKFKNWLRFGTKVRKEGNGIEKTLWQRMVQDLKNRSRYVLYVIKSLFICESELLPLRAASNATLSNIEEISETLPVTVAYAETSLLQKKVTLNQKTEKLVPINVEEITNEYSIKPVYAITVEKYGVYYCNGILLRNCDTVYDAIKIALIDKTIYIEPNPHQNTILKDLNRHRDNRLRLKQQSYF